MKAVVFYYIKKKCPQCSCETFPLIVDIVYVYTYTDIFLILQTNNHGISWELVVIIVVTVHCLKKVITNLEIVIWEKERSC